MIRERLLNMKAKQIPRIDIHDRIELKNALPLRMPYVIYIDPCDTCNFRWKFCPSGNREWEPLLNPHFAEMVRYAKASPCVERVDTTTNASLLTPERSLEIIDAGLDRLNISVEGINAEQYLDFTGHLEILPMASVWNGRSNTGRNIMIWRWILTRIWVCLADIPGKFRCVRMYFMRCASILMVPTVCAALTGIMRWSWISMWAIHRPLRRSGTALCCGISSSSFLKKSGRWWRFFPVRSAVS